MSVAAIREVARTMMIKGWMISYRYRAVWFSPVPSKPTIFGDVTDTVDFITVDPVEFLTRAKQKLAAGYEREGGMSEHALARADEITIVYGFWPVELTEEQADSWS